MSQVQLDTLSIHAAALGAENPLPPLGPVGGPQSEVGVGEADAEMRRNMAYGQLPTVLPHLLQDGYGRDRVPTELRTAVVENDVLRAEFLLDYGGRLWSLRHKATGRELLYRNEVLQPGNLALRNAWFAGGVEWNIGTKGHSPTTCAPLHAVRVLRPDGTPVLRMYEYERMRQLVFQIDAYLPDGASALMVHVRVVNPNDAEVPMYWWSNIAVPEAEDVRVVAPAEQSWYYSYDATMQLIGAPEHRGADYSYSTRSQGGADYFYQLPDAERRWIAALDGDGRGLVQTSTDRLRGRKLFVWGTGPGSAHWQQWLSPAGGRYVEIQAGLARTQQEHLPMPGRASWSWIEAYGLLEADPALVHGPDWGAARSATADALERLVPRADLDAELAAVAGWIDSAPVQALHQGSGWGALERRLRSAQGDDSLLLPGLPFGDETLGEQQQPWLRLLDTGRLPAGPPSCAPSSYQVHERWRTLLKAAEDWAGLLHLGFAHFHAGDPAAARTAWSRSAATEPNAWALRALAVLDLAEGDTTGAVANYLSALELAPEVLPLAVEAVDALVRSGRAADALDLIDAMPAGHRASGRIRLVEARAGLAVGDLPRVGWLLADGIDIADIREGEASLDQLWFGYQERRLAAAEAVPLDAALRARVLREFPVPTSYDFRMVTP